MRYGYRAENPPSLFEHYSRTRAEGFGPEVKRRIILGTYVLSSGYYDAYYLRAQKVRTLIRQDFMRGLRESGCAAFLRPRPSRRSKSVSARPIRCGCIWPIFSPTRPISPGFAAISIPCGFAESERGTELPIGLQIMGKALEEARILQVAHAYEESTDWHQAAGPQLARRGRFASSGAEPQRVHARAQGSVSTDFVRRLAASCASRRRTIMSVTKAARAQMHAPIASVAEVPT